MRRVIAILIIVIAPAAASAILPMPFALSFVVALVPIGMRPTQPEFWLVPLLISHSSFGICYSESRWARYSPSHNQHCHAVTTI
jgi:hypothetical protein